MKGITLIGMPGAGKSTVGKVLAERLGWRFVDLDQVIAEKQGMSHHEVMERKGPEGLARLEEEYALELEFTDTVFAPPGSIIYSDRAMAKISAESEVIHLLITPEEIEKRLGDRLYKNGIIGLKEKGLPGIMAERMPLYERYAGRTINACGMRPELIAKEIMKFMPVEV